MVLGFPCNWGEVEAALSSTKRISGPIVTRPIIALRQVQPLIMEQKGGGGGGGGGAFEEKKNKIKKILRN